ncbi:uncharacterized protein BX663DRAFT_419157, partial [Cokeromyces recurvatus]|uniref:uncharacterized protein n=1 Tax=Cokeromyces recurvatus TaxID=90255 RepID=UPI00221FC371
QQLKSWETKVKQQAVTSHDDITWSPLNLLAKTLNSTYMTSVVPPCWHHIYFPSRLTESELANDGYDTLFLPPKPFEQRLWAGARFQWSPTNVLQVGDKAMMKTHLDHMDIQRQDSVAVWINKDISNENGWSMSEQRCLVYFPSTMTRRRHKKGIQTNRQPEFSKIITPTSILLFRYSALTFNSHKIHFDHEYATNIEHHPACLVHGPLSGTLLMELLREQTKRRVISFEYRCLSPLYVNKPMMLAGKQSNENEYELWINDDSGYLAVKGTVKV